jgi:hypothetical protein
VKEVVVHSAGGGFTVMLNVLSAVEPLLSALKVKLAVPVVVGVPEMVLLVTSNPPVAPLRPMRL